VRTVFSTYTSATASPLTLRSTSVRTGYVMSTRRGSSDPPACTVRQNRRISGPPPYLRFVVHDVARKRPAACYELTLEIWWCC